MATEMETLFQYLKKSTSPIQANENSAARLEKAGFKALEMKEEWDIAEGGKYFVKTGETSLLAFTLPEVLPCVEEAPFFRMIGAHLDQPCLRVKPGRAFTDNGYYKLNVEVYGGPILSTWLDRPLSLAGEVTLTSGNPFKPQVVPVDLENPVLIIPNLAIHMNREVNKGVELNPQNDMLPVGALLDSQEGDYLLDALCEKLSVRKEDILDFDLFTYLPDEPELVGFKKDFISSPRLDDLIMASAGLEALTAAQSEKSSGINVLALFDHEEVGSDGRAGADSAMLSLILEKIVLNLGLSREDYIRIITGSFMISGDVAHAIHPAHPEKCDPLNRPKLGQGPVIKVAGSQSYVTHSPEYSVFEAVCKKAGVPVQKFTNRSDLRGGSTIGPSLTSWAPCRAMDMGIAILSMHSCRELMAAADYGYTVEAFKTYYNL